MCIELKILAFQKSVSQVSRFNLNHYFHRHVCPSIRALVRSSVRPSQNFFLLKSPWNHPLTPGVDPRGWPRVAPGHAAPPEELARARRALSSYINIYTVSKMCLLITLERALRALASSSGGAVCPGATWGQPRGSTPVVRRWFQGDLSKKIFVTETGNRTPNGRTDGQTDVLVKIVM